MEPGAAKRPRTGKPGAAGNVNAGSCPPIRARAGGELGYAYDGENRLTQVRTANGAVLELGYDALGRAVKLVDRSSSDCARLEVRVVYDGLDPIAEYEGCPGEAPTLAREYLTGATFLDKVAMVDYTARGDSLAGTAEVLHYLTDVQGSVVALTDASGDVVERYFYDAYGTTHIRGPDNEPLTESAYGNPFTYTAQRLHAQTGLLIFPMRAYDPRLGRWLQRDPAGYADSDNLYEYVRGNPQGGVDPLGLGWWDTLKNLPAGVVNTLTGGGTYSAGASAAEIWQGAQDAAADAVDIVQSAAEAPGAFARGFVEDLGDRVVRIPESAREWHENAVDTVTDAIVDPSLENLGEVAGLASEIAGAAALAGGTATACALRTSVSTAPRVHLQAARNLARRQTAQIEARLRRAFADSPGVSIKTRPGYVKTWREAWSGMRANGFTELPDDLAGVRVLVEQRREIPATLRRVLDELGDPIRSFREFPGFRGTNARTGLGNVYGGLNGKYVGNLEVQINTRANQIFSDAMRELYKPHQCGCQPSFTP